MATARHQTSEWVGPRCPGVSRCHQRGSIRPTAAWGWSMSGSSPASPATIPPATIDAPVAWATATPAAAPMTAWLRFIMAGSLGHGCDSGRPAASAVLGVVGVEAAAGVPLRALVAVSRDAAGPLQHRPQVHQVPGREGGVAVGEVVLGTAGPRVEVGRPRTGLADPAGVGLGRDRVAEVLEAVEDVHGAVLDPVLVAGEQAAADPAVVGVLAGLVQQARAGVQPLDDPLGDRAVVAQPCSVMSGHTPVAMSWSTARSWVTATPWRSMTDRLTSISPWVWLRSGS